jgi:hypothetical protein
MAVVAARPRFAFLFWKRECKLTGMNTDSASRSPAELRPIVREKIEQLDERGLELIHKVLMQLQAERLAEELTEGFSREQDLVARVDKAVATFRKAHPYK